MKTNHLPTLFVALCVAAGGCSLPQPDLGQARASLEAHEVPGDLCPCADLYGELQFWPESEAIYRIAAQPGVLVLAVDGELDCVANETEVAQRTDLAVLARIKPLGDGKLNGQGSTESPNGSSHRLSGEAVSAGERDDSNPLPAVPLPYDSADDSNPLPAKEGRDPACANSNADDSNPLPARDGRRTSLEHTELSSLSK
ncbi:MAG: hypothetical protein RBU30_04720 [Polyangia bacterium]|mgnify:CR=1 FL=1|nr:hypothetical protein [Polyangia bacterium]